MTRLPLIILPLLLTLSACTISPLPDANNPVPVVVQQPTATQQTLPAASPTVGTSGPGGFGYTVTDPSGKTVNVHYQGDASQRRLSVAIQPNGTVLLTASRDDTAQSMANMARALDRMAEKDPPADPVVIAEGDYYAPCSTDCECEGCVSAYESIEERELDPVMDGK